MKPRFTAVNGVPSFVVSVGEKGRIRHFAGDIYEPIKVASPTAHNLKAVWVRNERDAWAVGEHGIVLHWNGDAWLPVTLATRTDDLLTVWGCRGETWIGGVHRLIAHRQTGIGGALVSTAHVIRSIWGTGPDDVFYLADDHLIFRWGVDGCKIISTDDMEGDEYNAIGGGGEDDDVYVVGNFGVMMQRHGGHWLDVDTGIWDDIKGVAVEGPDVWIVTNRGELRHSPNCGRSWEVAATNIFGPLYGVAIVDGTVWACGEGGVILQHRPEDGGEKE